MQEHTPFIGRHIHIHLVPWDYNVGHYEWGLMGVERSVDLVQGFLDLGQYAGTSVYIEELTICVCAAGA